ncbi:MAG TPA: fumarylacetoacetate hydrolase family protein [Dehalococcoidia bacterium]|nr:fumarylacetoacetate hydrolase family protein [Dehalococcoidia bacterium]
MIDETFGFSRCVDQEGELGVVIGRTAKDVLRGKAKDYIVGYTCVNDVSERYAQKEDSQWAIDKGFDTFAPIGPWIETEIDPDDLKLETYLKGKLCQSARTSEPTFILCILQFVFSLNF